MLRGGSAHHHKERGVGEKKPKKKKKNLKKLAPEHDLRNTPDYANRSIISTRNGDNGSGSGGASDEIQAVGQHSSSWSLSVHMVI
jgi:hypothetical protein